ncbi:Imm1 family immunity protein [Micromonospora sp. NBC_01813]|uniref:Imm1 family immunity protein n=1 Tax=Micromonospora sp. NBC_01813 TaxID=2975988 RepID=UPI002DDA37D3|nr:Imm1 family immunity protein [Micromonospora sp. NBC_01813]WSA07370.1 Imm1 family immunity protein [Micromonospora sp. NBC_01813]
MVALEVWFDQVPENDFGPGDPAIIVGDLTDLDKLIEHVLTATADRQIPSVVQANILGMPGLPVIEAGMSRDRGFISYTDRSGGFYSAGDTSRSGDSIYDYMGNEHIVPASAEIPLSEVRQWLADFVTTGGPSVAVPLVPEVS